MKFRGVSGCVMFLLIVAALVAACLLLTPDEPRLSAPAPPGDERFERAKRPMTAGEAEELERRTKAQVDALKAEGKVYVHPANR